MNTVKNTNYITIQGWMRTELDLKGNDLLVYALIYGFCQSEGQKFTGSLQYIADWCGATKQGVLKNLQNLISADLIVKEEYYVHGVKIVEYYTTEFNGSIKLSLTPVKQSLINNNSNTINNKNVNTNVLTKKSSSRRLFGVTPTTNDIPTDNDITVKEEKPKRKNVYQKCVDAIEEFSTDETTRRLLKDYLSIRLQMKDSPIYFGQWKGLLNKLDKMSNTETGIQEIVRQSIEYGWKSFFEVNNTPKGKSGSKYNWHEDAANKNVHSVPMSEADKDALQKDIERRIANGERVNF